jgi:hypothetical protein
MALRVLQDPRVTEANVFVFILVGSVVFLMTSLLIIAGAFDQLNLSDRRQALGLPEGSIRALIALILILIFIMFGLLLYNGAVEEEQSRLAQQLLTTIGTLVVAVAGFYFGSTTVASATAAVRGGDTRAESVITAVTPPGGPTGTPVILRIEGRDFRMPRAVRLSRGNTSMSATDVLASATLITGTVLLDQPPDGENWDLVVEYEDGTEARLAKAFAITSA